jgi:hypothetical protein
MLCCLDVLHQQATANLVLPPDPFASEPCGTWPSLQTLAYDGSGLKTSESVGLGDGPVGPCGGLATACSTFLDLHTENNVHKLCLLLASLPCRDGPSPALTGWRGEHIKRKFYVEGSRQADRDQSSCCGNVLCPAGSACSHSDNSHSFR